jgi:hypothetical protein
MDRLAQPPARALLRLDIGDRAFTALDAQLLLAHRQDNLLGHARPGL